MLALSPEKENSQRADSSRIAAIYLVRLVCAFEERRNNSRCHVCLQRERITGGGFQSLAPCGQPLLTSLLLSLLLQFLPLWALGGVSLPPAGQIRLTHHTSYCHIQ